MSERTRPQGVERLAARLFSSDEVTRIVAVRLPEARSAMHLDTVMTMVDGERFIKYAGLGMLPAYTIERGDHDKEMKVTGHEPEATHDEIAAAPVLDSIEVITHETHVWAEQRAQRDDGWTGLEVRCEEGR